MPGRSFSISNYRFGFNGKENDNEVKGNGNQQDYGMRIYDPRLGKFLSIDPLTKSYPELTPYQFASNTPIQAIDLDGLEAWLATKTNWEKSDIEGFFNYAKPQLEKYKEEDVDKDCADMAIRLLVDYAAANKLPLKLNTYSGSIDNTMTKFNGIPIENKEDFLKQAQDGIDTKNILKNTVPVADENTWTGDFKIYTKPEGAVDVPYHVVIMYDPHGPDRNSIIMSASQERGIRIDSDWGGSTSASGSGNSSRWDFKSFTNSENSVYQWSHGDILDGANSDLR